MAVLFLIMSVPVPLLISEVLLAIKPATMVEAFTLQPAPKFIFMVTIYAHSSRLLHVVVTVVNRLIYPAISPMIIMTMWVTAAPSMPPAAPQRFMPLMFESTTTLHTMAVA